MPSSPTASPRPPDGAVVAQAALTHALWAEVGPCPAPVMGTCQVPGSKSFSNRALLIAAFAHGTSHLQGLLHSDDAAWCRDLLGRLGIDVRLDPDAQERASITGCGGQPPRRSGALYLGDAGTLARFVPGLLAAAPLGDWHLDGSAQLRSRPLMPLLVGLRALGGRLEAAGGGLPLRVRGGGLRAGSLVVPGAISSQYLSGLLIAAACGGIDLTVRCDTPLVQPAYVQMTQTCLQAFGADLSRLADATWRVAPAHLAGIPYIVEADASTACYFWGAAAATGGRVVVANIDARCTQADMAFLPLLQQMGCTVEHLPQGIAVTGPARLRGNFEADLQHCADQAPTLAALAALADGPIIIRNVAHIRHHECDRIAAMAAVLDGLGGRVEAAVDGLRVAPQALHGAAVSSHGDHRIAMATALLALRTPGVRILGPACVSKTCPEFFSLLRSLGVAVQLHGRGHA